MKKIDIDSGVTAGFNSAFEAQLKELKKFVVWANKKAGSAKDVSALKEIASQAASLISKYQI